LLGQAFRPKHLYNLGNTTPTMPTLGSGKPVSLIDREMLESVDGKVDLGDCDRLYIDSDVDLELAQRKVAQIKNVAKIFVPWPIYKLALKRARNTGEVIGYEGEVPLEQEPAEKKDTTIKNLDSSLFQRVKALATLKGLTIGEAVNQAMEMWLKESDQNYTSNKRMELLKKLEELSDKKNDEGMDEEIFGLMKKGYAKEIEMLDRLDRTDRTDRTKP